ncbi:uncharacterized protein LOC134228019 isoform X1 [Armigeres subalbatus]|uniref:uncharacterized protein LOC134228019 isoform X1 n=1 Tax=Armigeres subalbatus TaxID=124917 RepID=UPI002ECFEF2B
MFLYKTSYVNVDRNISQGILCEMLLLLDEKLSLMDDCSRDCGLFLDEMSIDEAKELCPNLNKWYGTVTLPDSEALATKGLVFMLGGIAQRWKQTVAFEFTGNSVPGSCLKSIVEKIIEKAEDHNLRVHFVTSDCGSANKAMWVEFGVNVRKDTLQNNLSIQHPVDPSRKLEFIADPVHIFKNSVHGFISNKNIFLPDWYVEKHGLSTNIVDREHIKALVDEESNQPMFYKLAGRLTAADVDFDRRPLSNVDKMKVTNATKYCNHNLVAALEVISEKTGREELKATAAYLGDLAKWYDIVNSRDDSSALQPANSVEYASALEHMSMMCRLFSDLSVGEKRHWKPWQSAAVMSTKALIRLQAYFFSTGYTILYTSRLTQDCLENLFSVVRAKQKRPTALQMKQHLRTITLSQYMHVPQHSSYDVDERQYLVTFTDILKRNPVSRCTKRSKIDQSACSSSFEQSVDITEHEISSVSEPIDSITENVQEAENEPLDVSCNQSDTMKIAINIISLNDRANLNAFFQVSHKIVSAINSKLCQKCRATCITSIPFNKDYAQYTIRLHEFRKFNRVFPSEDFFHFIIGLDYWYNKLRADKRENYSKLYNVPMPQSLMNCHNLKEESVKILIKLKTISEKIWKTRKSKYDSRSMVV